ncbi:MAG: hypothetical protein DRO15_05345 [Thermoprotei archaeon]|nr:MAG: hypothetical protein DRO15_05345 [Thermoprotei archaeon]
MTGPGFGKLRIDDAKVYLILPTGIEEIPADTYIHVKGYLRARVTHLDLEHEELSKLYPPRTTGYFPLVGTGSGFLINLSRLIKGVEIEVRSQLLASHFISYGEKTWVYIGGKVGGIFIGFKKRYILRLERIAIEIYKVHPK